MAIDALSSVPLGRSDTGEAVVLGKGNFEDFTGNILKLRQKEGEERKQTNAEIGKLLQDQVQSKWAKDNIDIFQPRMQAIKDKTLELYKEKKGRLNSVDLYGIQSEWNKLKAEADASNSLYAEEQNRIKALETDPKGLKYDPVESQKLRDLYRDPMSNPELAKEVKDQFGGSIIKWRANNERRFANIPAYDFEKDANTFADKNLVTDYVNKDKNGYPIYEKTPTGEYVTKKRTGFDPKKSALAYDEHWNRNTYEGKKFREKAAEGAAQNVTVMSDGSVSPITEEGLKIIKSANINPSMSIEQKQNALAKAYGIEYIKPKGGKEFLDSTGRPPQPRTSSSSSSEDKKAFKYVGNGTYSKDGFTFKPGDVKSGTIIQSSGGWSTKLGINTNPKEVVDKSILVNTESTGGVAKLLTIEDGQYKGKEIRPEIIIKTKDGNYYTKGSVYIPKYPLSIKSVAENKIVITKISPEKVNSIFNTTQDELDQMFKGEPDKKQAPNNKSTPKFKGIPKGGKF